MDETFIMNHVKETCCYASTDFRSDLEACRYFPPSQISTAFTTETFHSANPKSNPIVQEYILPDLSRNKYGRVRQPEDMVSDTDQLLVMNNERFTVPEILFRPDDIGLPCLMVFF
jgi:actin-related protein 6